MMNELGIQQLEELAERFEALQVIINSFTTHTNHMCYIHYTPQARHTLHSPRVTYTHHESHTLTPHALHLGDSYYIHTTTPSVQRARLAWFSHLHWLINLSMVSIYRIIIYRIVSYRRTYCLDHPESRATCDLDPSSSSSSSSSSSTTRHSV